jgi:hypothetical protein
VIPAAAADGRTAAYGEDRVCTSFRSTSLTELESAPDGSCSRGLQKRADRPCGRSVVPNGQPRHARRDGLRPPVDRQAAAGWAASPALARPGKLVVRGGDSSTAAGRQSIRVRLGSEVIGVVGLVAGDGVGLRYGPGRVASYGESRPGAALLCAISASDAGQGSIVPNENVRTSVPGGCWMCRTTFV